MPLTPSFSATESLAYPNIITLTDTSEGSDGTLTNRKIYIRLADGTFLANGVDWPYADASIELDVLAQAQAPEITVTWLSGSSVSYTYSNTFDFTLYQYIFALGLLQDLTSRPQTLQDANYYNSLIQFIVNLTNSENAIEFGGDIYSAQGALDLNQNLINNENLYF